MYVPGQSFVQDEARASWWGLDSSSTQSWVRCCVWFPPSWGCAQIPLKEPEWNDILGELC